MLLHSRNFQQGRQRTPHRNTLATFQAAFLSHHNTGLKPCASCCRAFSPVGNYRVVTPLDIEPIVGLSEGNIFAGELFSPQMFLNRPAPRWNQYRTPIEGYYQCGSGTHPGGGVMGGPGKLAAQKILMDRSPSK